MNSNVTKCLRGSTYLNARVALLQKLRFFTPTCSLGLRHLTELKSSVVYSRGQQ